MTKYLAFDLEISKYIPDGETDWKAYRPLGISCWAVAWVNKDAKIETAAGHGIDVDGNPTPQMSRDECQRLVRWLLMATGKDGYTLLTHNGAGFDLDVLAEESDSRLFCAGLARNSVDTCFLVHCLKGFPVGLEAIARGMRLQGKTEGMSGAQAPVLWTEGKYAEVLEYVQQDVRATLSVALEIEQRRALQWVARSGRLNYLPVPKLLTVKEAMQLPEPNTSWMTEPIPRSRFTAWMNSNAAAA